MIKGLDVFKEYFSDYNDQYVLIGGAACDIVFNEVNAEFRPTRDFDVVLIVEALTPEFGKRLWEFIEEGGYENRLKSDGSAQFYRFDKPKSPDFPFMIELFARTESVFDDDPHTCRRISLGDELTSLSAILLNSDYYQLLLTGKTVMSDLSILPDVYLILFKAKAWLNLTEARAAGLEVKGSDIRKHKNDVARLAALLTGTETCAVPESILADLSFLAEAFESDPPNFASLNLAGVTVDDILATLSTVYKQAEIE